MWCSLHFPRGLHCRHLVKIKVKVRRLGDCELLLHQRHQFKNKAFPQGEKKKKKPLTLPLHNVQVPFFSLFFPNLLQL